MSGKKLAVPKRLVGIESVKWGVPKLVGGGPEGPSPLRIVERPVTGPVRRIVRIMLLGDPVESAKKSLRALAEGLRDGTLSESAIRNHAGKLERIAGGEDPKLVFGLKPSNRGEIEPDRTRIMALDYLVRTTIRPKPRKIERLVASDWNEKVDTVKQIYRRGRKIAEELLCNFAQSECRRSDFDMSTSGRLYIDAIAAARTEILTGEQVPIVKAPEEMIEITYDWTHVVYYLSKCDSDEV